MIPAEDRSSQSSGGKEQDLLDAWYAESTTLGTDSLFGTIYDEVLIWTLCIFCAAAKQPSAEHIGLLKSAFERNGVDDLEALDLLLARYVTPRSVLDRLRAILDLA